MAAKNLSDIYPNIIRNLPEADIPFDGVRGWISQSEDHQIVFFDIDPIGEVAEHTHGPQWGMVIDGEMELTIGGKTNIYRKGGYYYVPDGVLHSATFKRQTRVMDFYVDKNRYSPK